MCGIRWWMGVSTGLVWLFLVAAAEAGDPAKDAGERERRIPMGAAVAYPAERAADHALATSFRGRVRLLESAILDDAGSDSVRGRMPLSSHRSQVKYLAQLIGQIELQIGLDQPLDASVVDEIRRRLFAVEQAVHPVRYRMQKRRSTSPALQVKAAGDVISGRVVDDFSVIGLEGVKVQLFDRDRRLAAETYTDANGNYSITVQSNSSETCDFHSGGGAFIPDSGGGYASSTVIVPPPPPGNGNGVVTDVGVQVAIAHGYPHDLTRFTLQRPNGSAVNFENLNSVCSYFDFRQRVDAFFHDDGLPFITCAMLPDNNTVFMPNLASLRGLAGMPAAGNWTLEVQDTVSSISGQLEAWNLFLCQGFDAQQPYYLKTSSPGEPTAQLPDGPYVDELYDNIVCEPECDFAGAAPISGVLSDKNFRLARGGSISGIVTQSGTSPAQRLGDVTITVFDSLDRPIRTTMSNVLGEWTVRGLPTGRYYVLASQDTPAPNGPSYLDQLYQGIACEFGCDHTRGTGIQVTAGAAAPPITISMRVASFIGGTVTDEVTLAPLQFVEIGIYDRFGAEIERGIYTGADGVYRSRHGYPPGEYRVATLGTPGYTDELFSNKSCEFCADRFRGTAVVIPPSGDSATQVNFALSNTYGAISGQVIDVTDQAIPNVPLEVVNFEGRVVVRGIFSGPSGEFTVSGLDAGSYFIQTADLGGDFINTLYEGVDCPPFNGTPRCPTVGGTEVVVDPPGTKVVQLVLRNASSISGVITENGVTPLGGVEIRVLKAPGVIVSRTLSEFGSGAYRVGGLAPGRYYVVTRNTLGKLDEIYDGAQGRNCHGSGDFDCGFANAQRIVVGEDADVANIQFDLASGSTIEGRVTDALAVGIPNLEVQVYNASGTLITSTFTNFNGDYSTGDVTTAAGFGYRRGAGLASAAYRVAVREHEVVSFEGERYVDEVYPDVACPSPRSRTPDIVPMACSLTAGSTPVTVTVPVGVTGVNFTLLEGGTVFGKLAGGINERMERDPFFPQFNVPQQLSISDVEVLNAAGRVVSRTRGLLQYEAGGLPSGSYKVRAVSPFGQGEAWDDLSCPNMRCGASVGHAFEVFIGIPVAQPKDFDFDVGGLITGTVRKTSDGLPLAGASVSLYAGAALEATALTDANGRYAFNGVVPGTKHVTAARTGYVSQVFPVLDCADTCVATGGAPIEVLGGNNPNMTPGVDFALRLTDEIFSSDFE